jgi:hypothetical protein
LLRDSLAGVRVFSGWVEVFNAQQPAAIVGFGIKIASKGRD